MNIISIEIPYYISNYPTDLLRQIEEDLGLKNKLYIFIRKKYLYITTFDKNKNSKIYDYLEKKEECPCIIPIDNSHLEGLSGKERTRQELLFGEYVEMKIFI